MYAKVICVELAQSKQASDPPLLGKNIPKDHDGIFSPVLPTSIPEPPIDINLTLFPSGNCAMFSVFCDNELPYYTRAPFPLKNTIVFQQTALPRATFSAGFFGTYFHLLLCDQTHKGRFY